MGKNPTGGPKPWVEQGLEVDKRGPSLLEGIIWGDPAEGTIRDPVDILESLPLTYALLPLSTANL